MITKEFEHQEVSTFTKQQYISSFYLTHICIWLCYMWSKKKLQVAKYGRSRQWRLPHATFAFQNFFFISQRPSIKLYFSNIRFLNHIDIFFIVYSVPENRKTIGREPISLTDKSLEVSLVTSAHGKELNIEKSET